jgi:hypothetical protein
VRRSRRSAGRDRRGSDDGPALPRLSTDLHPDNYENHEQPGAKKQGDGPASNGSGPTFATFESLRTKSIVLHRDRLICRDAAMVDWIWRVMVAHQTTVTHVRQRRRLMRRDHSGARLVVAANGSYATPEGLFSQEPVPPLSGGRAILVDGDSNTTWALGFSLWSVTCDPRRVLRRLHHLS